MKTDAGYTLFEMLVALAIVSIMAFPVSESLRTGLRVWTDTHKETERSEQVYLAQDRLRTWLGNAYPAYYDRFPERTFPLTGNIDSISFIAPINSDTRADDLYQVSLLLRDDGVAALQVLGDHMAEGVTCVDQPTECISAELINGVSSLELAYFDPDNLVWSDTWNEKIHIPSAVRVRMGFVQEDQLWPELIVSLSSEQWARCEFQPTTLNCG